MRGNYTCGTAISSGLPKPDRMLVTTRVPDQMIERRQERAIIVPQQAANQLERNPMVS